MVATTKSAPTQTPAGRGPEGGSGGSSEVRKGPVVEQKLKTPEEIAANAALLEQMRADAAAKKDKPQEILEDLASGALGDVGGVQRDQEHVKSPPVQDTEYQSFIDEAVQMR